MLLAAMAELRKWDIAWIIAPHEIDKARIAAQGGAHPERMGRYSELDALPEKAEVLWIDNIGMLSNLYQYAETRSPKDEYRVSHSLIAAGSLASRNY